MKEMHCFSYFTEFLFKDSKLFVSDENKNTFARPYLPKSNIFPLNVLCVFFILTLEKE